MALHAAWLVVVALIIACVVGAIALFLVFGTMRLLDWSLNLAMVIFGLAIAMMLILVYRLT